MGTHFTLLREPQSNAAKVFLFGERIDSQKLKAWRFLASADSARVPGTTFADSTSVLIDIPHPDTLQNDLFCNGHAPLPDGRMLFVGGWYVPTDPCEMTYVFDPAWFTPGTSPWTLGPTMATERWYATATSLADGRILAAGGLARSWQVAFGGLDTSGASQRVVRPLAVAGRYHWGDTTAVPGYDHYPDVGRAPRNAYTAGQFPPSRTDHAFAWAGNGAGVLFGGRHVAPGGASTLLGDAWMLEHADERVPGDSVASWRRLRQLDYDDTPGEPELIPPPRSRATLVWAGIPSDDKHRLPNALRDLTCFLFGGRDTSGHVFSDLWVGKVDTGEHYDATIGMVRDIRWQRLLADDTPARARFGHTTWFDPGDANQPGAPYARLVVFGGQTGDSTLADTLVYSYGVGSGTSPTWQSHLPAKAGKWGRPPARQGHAATFKWPVEPGRERQFYLYGGQDARGNLLTDPLWSLPQDTHVWALSRTDATANSPAYAWKWLAWTNADSGKAGPRARARAAMTYDDASGRLLVSGGDLNGDGQGGGLTDSLWLFQASGAYGNGAVRAWALPAMRGMGHPAMPPTSGHTLISYGSGGYTMDNSLETFTAGVTGQQCEAGGSVAGVWQTLSLQDSTSQRVISWYPYLFLLPDGRLFHAGPAQGDRIGERPYRRFFDLRPGSADYRKWRDDASVYFQDAWAPGSAVMYRPGKVLRAGSHAGVDQPNGTSTNATGRTETIDIAADAMPAWVNRVPDLDATFPLAPRLNHNLTVLPTGDVLVTGGVKGELDPGDLLRMAVRRPQLWRVQTGGWNDTSATTDLAADPKVRNYHSAALLLPDGRVMTAGGEPPNASDRFTVSLYEPPYLFSGNGHARRPVIAGAPEHLRYGEPFTLAIGTGADSADVDSIRAVALLRPGAVTHGFDQSQRYVPLDFVPRSNPRRILGWAPADSFLAPPGEYMLFVTRGRGTSADSLPVPSIAKWVIVERPQGTQRDSLDSTPPRGGAFVNLQRTNPCEPNSEVALQWTAPADDDTLAFSGRARSYDLRWTLNYQAPHFNLWNAHATSAPQAVFATETATVTGLQSSTWYRFALRAVGDNADTSSLSNVLVAKALVCDEGSSGGSGGGEGAGARRAGAAGSRIVQGPAGEENTLLAGVPLGERSSDVLRLRGEPALLGSARRAYVRQGGRRGLLVERARLLAVDHAAGAEVVALPGGALLAGARAAAAQVRDRSGADLTAAATAAAPEPVYADSGEVLEVTLPELGEPASRTGLFELLGGGTEGGGVGIEVRRADGSWQAVGTLHPRREWDTRAVGLGEGGTLRLTFHDACALRFAGELAAAAPAAAQLASLAGAHSNYSGDVFDAARGAVDTTLALVAGDTLALAFADLAPPAEGAARTWLLEVEGTPVTPRLAQSLARRRDPAPRVALPMHFALLPAAPNPARGTVRLAFDLPVRASVRLELFDPQGRRVRRLEGEYAPGRQSFEWDLRHAGGPRVAPGIYSYRLTAGPFRAQSKLVVLP